METLSNTLTPLHVPKPLTPIHHHHHHQPTTVKPTAISSFSQNKPPPSTASFRQKDKCTPLYPRYYRRKTPSALPPLSLTFKPPQAAIHRNSASGYAAALLDIAQCKGAVLEVARDVRRLLRLLRNGEVREFMGDELVEEKEKGEAVKELVEKGKFEAHVVGLVKMVIEKGKRVGMVKEALEEFENIFYQLTPVGLKTTPA